MDLNGWICGNLSEQFLDSRRVALDFYLMGLSHMYSDWENVAELQRNEIHSFFVRGRTNVSSNFFVGPFFQKYTTKFRRVMVVFFSCTHGF